MQPEAQCTETFQSDVLDQGHGGASQRSCPEAVIASGCRADDLGCDTETLDTDMGALDVLNRRFESDMDLALANGTSSAFAKNSQLSSCGACNTETLEWDTKGLDMNLANRSSSKASVQTALDENTPSSLIDDTKSSQFVSTQTFKSDSCSKGDLCSGKELAHANSSIPGTLSTVLESSCDTQLSRHVTSSEDNQSTSQASKVDSEVAFALDHERISPSVAEQPPMHGSIEQATCECSLGTQIDSSAQRTDAELEHTRMYDNMNSIVSDSTCELPGHIAAEAEHPQMYDTIDINAPSIQKGVTRQLLMEESIMDEDVMARIGTAAEAVMAEASQKDVVPPEAPERPPKRARVEQSQVVRSGTSVIRASFGHSLAPPEQGAKVRVHGDGWGNGEGDYTAIVTEADPQTFTIVVDSGPDAWTETHVLREYCTVLTS